MYRHTLSVRQSSSSYASVAELRAGGDCPGARSVACHNDSDVGTLTYTNTLRTAENVFYNQVTHNHERVGIARVASCLLNQHGPVLFRVFGWEG